MDKTSHKIKALCIALALINDPQDVQMFLNDLCTPQELKNFAERWDVCRLLDSNLYTYRQINELTGISLATITRVARFLKNENNKGYITTLNKLKREIK